MNAPPWLQPLNEQLQQALAEDRLAHAWLVHGPAGLGKRLWAEQARRLLLCEREQACGRCTSCRLVDSGAHPDSMDVEPDGRWVRVEAVRRLIHWAGLRAQQGRRKVCVIHQAHSMNPAAANALLKTLEEPPGESVFLLLADQLETLPATIRSRCRLLHLPLPPREQALQWLQAFPGEPAQQSTALRLAGGNPGRAAVWLERGKLPAMLAFLDALRNLWADPRGLNHALERADELEAAEVLELCWFISSECIKIAAGLRLSEPFCPGRVGDPAQLFRLQRQASQAQALLGTGVGERGLISDWLLNWIKAGASA